MKRNTLTRNLKEMMERIRHTVLPVTILKVYVHGSYIRGDDLPGDLDIVILAKVKDEWAQWSEAFRSLNQCHNLIWEYYEKGMSLEDVMRGPLVHEIEKRNIPMEWVTTMSWSELWGRTTLYIPYMLFWDKVTRRILTKGMKGLHIQLETLDGMFTPVSGRLHLYHDIPAFLIWSNESPESYELEPNADELEAYLKLEHEKLQTEMADARFRAAVGELLIEKSLLVVPKEKLGDVALRVIWNTPKYEATEEMLREGLRKLGIPENKVYAIRQRGTKTWYSLARTKEEEIKLRNHVRNLEETNKAQSKVQKLLRKVVSKNEAAKVDCWVVNLKKGKVVLHVTKPAAMDQDHFGTLWKSRGFKIEDVFGRIFGRKETFLLLDSSEKKMAEEISKSLRS